MYICILVRMLEDERRQCGGKIVFTSDEMGVKHLSEGTQLTNLPLKFHQKHSVYTLMDFFVFLSIFRH